MPVDWSAMSSSCPSSSIRTDAIHTEIVSRRIVLFINYVVGKVDRCFSLVLRRALYRLPDIHFDIWLVSKILKYSTIQHLHLWALQVLKYAYVFVLPCYAFRSVHLYLCDTYLRILWLRESRKLYRVIDFEYAPRYSNINLRNVPATQPLRSTLSGEKM